MSTLSIITRQIYLSSLLILFTFVRYYDKRLAYSISLASLYSLDMMRWSLGHSVFLLTVFSVPTLSLDSNENLHDALLAIGKREMALPLDWNEFDQGMGSKSSRFYVIIWAMSERLIQYLTTDLWPYFDVLRHIDLFEERTKVVHKLDDRIEFLHQGPLENITCALCDSLIKIILDSLDEGNKSHEIKR